MSALTVQGTENGWISIVFMDAPKIVYDFVLEVHGFLDDVGLCRPWQMVFLQCAID